MPIDSHKDETSLLLKASSQLLFETLMEHTADRIYIKDLNSRFIACSLPLARMHDYPDRQSIEGMSDFELFSMEHAQQAYDDEQELLRTEIPIINKLEKETWKNGSITWASSSKAPLYLSCGTLAGIIGISRDVTSEIQAQEKFAASEARLKAQNELMRCDYENARKVQSVMIPGRVPDEPQLEIAYLWQPMASVGGDMISFPRTPDDTLLFVMSDVSGHGATAAFYTVLLKYLTSNSAKYYHHDPQAFLNDVNQEIIGKITNGFVTGLAGHFSPRAKDGSRKLHLSHAGHRQILLFRASTKAIELVELPNGTIMGFPSCGASDPHTLTLTVGDRFYAFTDGVVEASNPAGEEFGMTRLIEAFKQLSSSNSLQETLDTIHQSALTFSESNDQQDDVSILGFELKD